jgi:hypothetical protein
VTQASSEETVKSVAKGVAASLGIEDRNDYYFFLARLGSNYDKYPFNWEPFRDLSGPLLSSDSSIPVLVISDDQKRTTPEIVREQTPLPHFRIFVSPSIPVAAIANAWLQLIAGNGAHHGSYRGPFDWYVRNLGISAADLSAPARKFLLL